jgi:peptidoglycan/LPS O-acetylase OafA/YrhL
MTAEIRKAAPKRFAVLDGIRGISAICVMLDHFLSSQVAVFGHCLFPFAQSAVAVDLFFMLSGFVLAHSYRDRMRTGMPVREIFIRRLIRLYPMYAIGMCMGIAVLLMLITAHETSFTRPEALESAVANLFFLPFFSSAGLMDMKIHHVAFGPLFPADTPAWTLFFEMIGTFFFVGFIRLRTRTVAILAAAAYVTFIGYGVHIGTVGNTDSFNPSVGWGVQNFSGGFLRISFGLLTGILLQRIHQDHLAAFRKLAPATLRQPWLLYAVTIAILANPSGLHGVIPAMMLVTLVPFIILAAADPVQVDRNTARISAYLGDLSYPIFCLHYPLGRLIELMTHHHSLSNLGFTLIASLVSLILGALFLHFLDMPARKLLSQYWKKNRLAAAARL